MSPQAVADMLDVPFRVFDVATLEAETPRLANPSKVVFDEIGCHGVSEAAALAAAGADGTLEITKRNQPMPQWRWPECRFRRTPRCRGVNRVA